MLLVKEMKNKKENNILLQNLYLNKPTLQQYGEMMMLYPTVQKHHNRKIFQFPKLLITIKLRVQES